MGTRIDAVSFIEARLRHRHSALHLADKAALRCLASAGVDASEVDLLINAGLYRDRNLGEPALAALIQEDVGANVGDPRPDAHGTFSFDVANGACGVLTGLQIADRFLRTGTTGAVLVVASDADPGHRLAPGFSFAPAGGALLCTRSENGAGLDGFAWGTWPDGGASYAATVGLDGRRNVLHVRESEEFGERAATLAAKVAGEALAQANLQPRDLGGVVLAGCDHAAFSTGVREGLGIDDGRVVTPHSRRLHTVAFVSALDTARRQGLLGRRPVLFVCAAAGITAGAAVYTGPSAS